jgi:hypothetical protein
MLTSPRPAPRALGAHQRTWPSSWPPYWRYWACGFTRASGVFPVGSEGWELIFDPLGSALEAAAAAVGLGILDALLFRRLVPVDER